MLKKTLDYIASTESTLQELRPYGGNFLPQYSKLRVIAELAFLNGTNKDLVKIGSNNGLYRLFVDREGTMSYLKSQIETFSPLDISQKIQDSTGIPIEGTITTIENETNFGKYLAIAKNIHRTNVLDILTFYRDLFSVVFEDLANPVSKLDDRKDYTFILDDTFKDVPIRERKGQFSKFAMDHLKAFFPAIFVAAYVKRIETQLKSEGKYSVVEASLLSMNEIKFRDNFDVQELDYDERGYPQLTSVGSSKKSNEVLPETFELLQEIVPHIKLDYTDVEEGIFSTHDVKQNNSVMHVQSDKTTRSINWVSFLKDFVQKKKQAPVIKIKF